MPRKRSEDSYIVNDILPFLNSNYNYPIHDAERVKIKEVPIFRPSGGRSGSSIDIVYYHNSEPVLLVEAKTDYKSHEFARKEALNYLKNFPIDKPEFAPSGIPPKFIATTVGLDIKFYKWSIDYSKPIPGFIAEEITILPFEKLLEYYGLASGYQARNIDSKNFRSDFFDELIAIFKTDSKEKKISPVLIKKVAYQIYNYLAYDEKYTGQYPYTELNLQSQKAIRDLLNRFNFKDSLGPENAKEFRHAVLRSFQGGGLNQYLTEQCVVAFMVKLLGKITPEYKVLDFECGSGGFLAATVDIGKTPLENIRGIDIDELPYIIAKTYMAIYFQKIGKESLNTIPIKQDNGLYYHGKDWDLIIGNPAGSNKYERDDLDKIIDGGLDSDLDRNQKLDKFSEYNLSIQQAVRSAKKQGKICLVLPEGVFSNSNDEFLRQHIARYCRVLAIISLPRRAFKKGTSTKGLKGGSQQSSQKMSILYAVKMRELIREDEPLKEQSLDYPVFLATVCEPESTKGPAGEWLEPRLDAIFKQWLSWQKNQVLIEPGEVKIESLRKITKKKKRKEKRQKLLFDIETKKKELPKYKQKILSKTKISTALKGIFKKRKKKH